MDTDETQDFNGWTILFDLDGTLVDTAPDLLGALNHVLTGMGLAPVPLEDVAEMIGHGARAMIETGIRTQGAALPATEMDAAFERFIAYYVDHIAVGSRPFDGAMDALDALREAGATLAVCTNKRQDLSVRLLEALGLTDQFDVVFGADIVLNFRTAFEIIGGIINVLILLLQGDFAGAWEAGLVQAIFYGSGILRRRAERDAG